MKNEQKLNTPIKSTLKLSITQSVAIIIFSLFVVCLPSLAAELHVPCQYPTIQDAIDNATNGDTVIVEPGHYFEKINFNAKVITVESTNPDNFEIVAATIIDANHTGSVVKFISGEGRGSVLTGFTITGGYGDGSGGGSTDRHGGGICCKQSSPTITKNIIENNSAYYNGGGIYLWKNSNAKVSNNIIKSNSAKKGGAIFINTSVAHISSNIIVKNSSSGDGSGICINYCSPQIINNTIVSNSGSYALYYQGGESPLPDVRNCIFWGNSNDAWSYYPFISYSRLSVINTTADTGIGTIYDEPAFVNPMAGDYHLEANSPCINTGDTAYVPEPNETDIDGEQRILFGRIDIGADEYSGNLRPIADAGDDQSMSVIPSLITLDGSGSYDLNGDNLTYRWKQIGGWKVTLSDPNAVRPTFTHPWPGIYVFELTVSDGVFTSLPDTIGIVICVNRAPIADAGLPRYVTTDSVTLDGTGSYDPDGYGILTYQWKQISGPTVTITGADSHTPLVSGFTQTSAIQTCTFELVVSDGDLTSLPGNVTVTIVPNFGSNVIELTNPPFDPDKPTIVAFGGGDCSIGGGMTFGGIWAEKANWITASYGTPYYKYGDMLIVYLSSVAPDYKQPIQTIGHSTGNMPAIDVANRLNSTYSDPRYAVNRITFLDAACRDDYSGSINTFLGNPVDGEQGWIDNYIATHSKYYSGTLNITFPGGAHQSPLDWVCDSQYESSWPNNDMYNGGITAGFYYSVAGPGKNLQLAANTSKYYFKWINSNPDYLVAFSSSYPGRLPEIATLVGPENGAVIDANGMVLSCGVSENAVRYQLLFGSDPYRVMDYNIISDTPDPPNEIIAELPFQQTWWTVRAYDQYGSTIYADPRLIMLSENIEPVADAGPDQTVYAWIDGKVKVALDGSDSNDTDGDTLTYTWAWMIDANMYEANGINSTIELPIGVHTIQLMVNDGCADSAPDDVNVTVVAPLEGNLKITPQTINRRSNEPHIQAIIQIPDGIAMRDIDSSEPLILYPGGIKATKQSFAAGNGISADFNKDALMAAVPTNGKTELKVAGKLKSGRYFCGDDKVMIISPSNKWR